MNWYKKAKQQIYPQDIGEELKKYKNLDEFKKNFEILYHGGSENIIGDKLSLNARLPGEVTEENVGKGQDAGGIFFTPEKDMASTFSHHSPSGKGAIHSFLVKTNNLFDENNRSHTNKLKNFIGQYYINEDGEKVQFTYQMYDFIFPQLSDGKRHMDWATMDPNILSAIGFEGAKVIEKYDAYGDGKHLYSTVLFSGGENSPHWKINSDDTLEKVYDKRKK